MPENLRASDTQTQVTAHHSRCSWHR